MNEVKQKYFISTDPLVLRSIPVKEKRKFICFTIIASQFEKSLIYTEKEINEILKSIYPLDYAIIRRYLIDYKFLSREDNGRSYWVTET